MTIDELFEHIKRSNQDATRDGNEISAGGSLYLNSLTSLPDGVTLSAGGSLDLRSLADEWQVYRGQRIRLRMVDGFAMRLISSREVGEVTLWRAQYFRGNLDTDPKCYVAQLGDLYAHGKTAERALRDLRFKIAQVDFDCDELVETIRERGTVTFNDYRLLTGACESGLQEGLRSLGLDPDLPEMALTDALRLSKGHYGGERFAELLA